MRLPRLLRSASAQVIAIVLAVGAAVVAAPAAIATQPVDLDDFAGTVRGVRSIEREGTATFAESGGKATVTTESPAGSIGRVTLRYAIPTVDLTAGGSNGQFFLEFDSIVRSPGASWETAASISITLVDSKGDSSTAGASGINSAPDGFDIVRPLCKVATPGCSGGFSGGAEFEAITEIAVTISHPKNYDGASKLTAVIDAIRTTPLGGAAPAPRAATVTTAARTVSAGAAGTTLDFNVAYAGSTPFGSGGFAMNQFVTTTTGGTHATVVEVGGMPDAHTVRVAVSGDSGTVRLRVPDGMFRDTWGQPTVGGSATVTYTRVPPPVLGALPTVAGVTGKPVSLDMTAPGATSYAIVAGALPAGLPLWADGLIIGTPLAAGQFNFTVQATDAYGQASQRAYSVRVLQAVTFPGQAGIAAPVDAPFVPTVIAVNPEGLDLARVALEGLPAGLSFDPGTLTISGSPTVTGTFPVTAVATSQVDPSVEVGRGAAVTIVVGTPPAPATLTDARIARGESATITLPAGSTYSMITGDLPDGLALAGPSLTGTPTAAGTYPLRLWATNAFGSAEVALTVVVTAPVTLSGATLDAVVGNAFTYAVVPTGYPVPTVSVPAGELPPGIVANLTGGELILEGTPTVPGTYVVSLAAANGLPGGAATATVTIVVRQPPAITPVADVTLRLGGTVDEVLVASGYPAPAWTGTLPAGLTLTDRGDGTARLHGTPTSSGSVSVSVTATNVLDSVTATFDVHVEEAPAFVSAADADLEAGVPASVVVRTVGFPVPTLAATGLPAGLTFRDGGDGTATVSGTPSAGGVATVRVTASSTAGSATQDLVLTVAAPPAVTSAPTSAVVAGAKVNLTVTAAGYPTPVLTLAPPVGPGAGRLAAATPVATTLPAGLTFTDNGDGTATIAGTPTVGGRFRPTVVATSSSGVSRQTLDLTVAAITSVDVAGEDDVVVGSSVDLTFRAGGYPTPSLRVVGLLPLGLTFTDNGDGTGSLSGAVALPGTYVVTVEADNGAVRRFTTTIVAEATATAPPTPTPAPPADPTPDADTPDADTPAPEDADEDAQDEDDDAGAPSDTDGPTSLPRTGAASLVPLVAALVAVALGVLMVGARRRRV